MEQKEYQIDYSEGEEPLVILPLCVGAAVLHGAFFRWFSSLDGGDEKLVIFMKLLYWSAVIGFGGIAAWRLIRTIHATSKGLEYRFLGKTRKIIPWNEFSCACKCRSYYYRNDMIYLIPKSCGVISEERRAQVKFTTSNYRNPIRFHPTKNNLRAIGTYLAGF